MMISIWRCSWVKVTSFLAVMLLAASGAAYAEAGDSLKINLDDKVIYCGASYNQSNERFLHALKDGIPVVTVWNVEVERLRSYWLNESVVGITVTRRVVPDLLSRSWLLEDQASGISRRVYTVADAIQFLSTLEHLPVLDRALLMASETYVMSASIEVHTGEVNDTWWGESNQASMQQEFSLP